jgi:hypothetical protein
MTNTNGMQVGGGYYWNASSWEVEVVPNEGGALRGGSGAKYVKVPFPVLFLVVPLLGATFLMFLPVIGFGLVAYALAKRLAAHFTAGATELASTVQPGGFATGAAYFTGRAGETEEGAPGAAGLEQLASEIEARKAERK